MVALLGYIDACVHECHHSCVLIASIDMLRWYERGSVSACMATIPTSKQCTICTKQHLSCKSRVQAGNLREYAASCHATCVGSVSLYTKSSVNQSIAVPRRGNGNYGKLGHKVQADEFTPRQVRCTSTQCFLANPVTLFFLSTRCLCT